MPKGLIPLIAGLGAAGTMVGISIPSAVTVIPKKEETPKYTGWVFDHKIYKTELEAKQALVASLNAIGPKEEGVFGYTALGLAGEIKFKNASASLPSASDIASKLSFENKVANVESMETTRVSILQSSESPWDAMGLKVSLSPNDAAPTASLPDFDTEIYSGGIPTITWSGDFASSWSPSTSWQGITAPTGANAANFAIRFVSDDHHSFGKVVYIYTSETETTIKNGKTNMNQADFYLNHIFHQQINRQGHPAKDQYDLVYDKTGVNSKLGTKIYNNNMALHTINSTDITNIHKTSDPVAWSVANLTPAKLSAISKVHPTTEVVSGQPWTPYNTIASPTSIYKGVNNG